MSTLRDLATGIPPHVYKAAWIGWVVWFLLIETVALLDRDMGDTFTEHSRPIVQATSIGWFLAAGLIAWLGYHFLVQR